MRSSSLKRSATRATRARSSEEICRTRRIVARNLGHEGVAQEAHHLAREVLRALSFDQQAVDDAQDIFAGVRGHGVHHVFEDCRTNGADESAHYVAAQGVPQLAMAWSMMLSASRMEPSPASASMASALSSAAIPSCLAMSRSWPTMSSKRDGVKAEMLTARADGLRNVLGLRGRHHEDDVRRAALPASSAAR